MLASSIPWMEVQQAQFRSVGACANAKVYIERESKSRLQYKFGIDSGVQILVGCFEDIEEGEDK
jgi:hypothetical protein